MTPKNGSSFCEHKELERASTFTDAADVKWQTDYNEQYVVKRSISGNLGRKQSPTSKRAHNNVSSDTMLDDDTPACGGTRKVKRNRNEDAVTTTTTKNHNSQKKIIGV